MLQQGGVYPGVKAEEMLRHVASLHAHPLDVAALVERLGLGAAGRTTYRRLSGGQQQRLSLAMAVVGRPELVFLDEPTAGLDPQARRATWELVEALRHDGVTVVLTHPLHGRGRAAGRPGRGRRPRPGDRGGQPRRAHRRRRRRQPAVRRRRPAWTSRALRRRSPAASRVDEVAPGRYVVHGDVDTHLLADLTRWCADRDVMPEGLTVGRRSLEDVFLDLTGSELRA